MDWANAVDLEVTLANVTSDIVGDWYRDPWGWPEIAWVVNKEPDLLLARLSSVGVRRAQPIDVSKENFGTRPAMVMDPIDRLAYQALVDTVSVKLIGKQPVAAYGWRLPANEPKRGKYQSNATEWQGYREQLNWLSGNFESGLKTDIVSFFASIPLDRLEQKLQHRVGDGPIVQRIMSLLRGWDGVPSRRGLPQRSHASAVLANMYLSEVDDLLSVAGAPPSTAFGSFLAPDGRFARWMDDIWLFDSESSRLRSAQFELETLLRSMGLHMNTGKTHLLEGDELVHDARQVDHSAVDEALIEDIPSFEPLNDLIDRILASPEVASGTSVRFATVRMRNHQQYGRVQEFIDKAHLMPHAAGSLARLFRDSERWRDLDGWYTQYCGSDWMTTTWPAAQYATMFPRETSVPPLADYFERLLTVGPASLEMMAVAADRLASWHPARARVAIRECAKSPRTPLERRVLALAALTAGDERIYVTELLSEFEDNAVLLQMLKDLNFKAPGLVSDL